MTTGSESSPDSAEGNPEDWLLSRLDGSSLGPRARRVFEFLVTQPQESSFASASDIARRVSVDTSTAVRLAKRLGFPGWAALQQEIRGRYLASLSAAEVLDAHAPSAEPVTASIQQSSNNLKAVIASVETQHVNAVGKAIADASKTLVIGSGSFAALGIHLAYTSRRLGYEVSSEWQGGTQLAAAIGRLDKGDVLIATNFWRLPREVLRSVEYAAGKQVTTCVITDLRSSPLAKFATHLLVVPSESTSVFPSLVAGTALIDAILASLALQDSARTREALRRTEDVWSQLDLIHETSL